MRKDLIIKKKYAETIENKRGEEREGCIRVYCYNYPDVFTFQIRSYSSLTFKGKKRGMVSSVNLTKEEIKEILKYMEDEEKEVLSQEEENKRFKEVAKNE